MIVNGFRQLMPRSSRTAGFTLVEMTMALAITATVAVAAMAALDQLTDADARVTQHIESK